MCQVRGRRSIVVVHTADERSMLEAMIDWNRAGVIYKFAGWPDPAVRTWVMCSRQHRLGYKIILLW